MVYNRYASIVDANRGDSSLALYFQCVCANAIFGAARMLCSLIEVRVPRIRESDPFQRRYRHNLKPRTLCQTTHAVHKSIIGAFNCERKKKHNIAGVCLPFPSNHLLRCLCALRWVALRLCRTPEIPRRLYPHNAETYSKFEIWNVFMRQLWRMTFAVNFLRAHAFTYTRCFTITTQIYIYANVKDTFETRELCQRHRIFLHFTDANSTQASVSSIIAYTGRSSTNHKPSVFPQNRRTGTTPTIFFIWHSN